MSNLVCSIMAKIHFSINVVQLFDKELGEFVFGPLEGSILDAESILDVCFGGTKSTLGVPHVVAWTTFIQRLGVKWKIPEWNSNTTVYLS